MVMKVSALGLARVAGRAARRGTAMRSRSGATAPCEVMTRDTRGYRPDGPVAVPAG